MQHRTGASEAGPPRSPASRTAMHPSATTRRPGQSRLTRHQQHRGDGQQDRVHDRDTPEEIASAPKVLEIVPAVFPESHHDQIEITTAEAQGDRQQDRGRRVERDSARRRRPSVRGGVASIDSFPLRRP